MSAFIRLHPQDDVVIARSQLISGSTVEGTAVRGLIPPGHKICLLYTSPSPRATTSACSPA